MGKLICNRCKIPKDATTANFHRSVRGLSPIAKICIECVKKQGKELRDKKKAEKEMFSIQ